MTKRVALAIIVILVLWAALDFVIHGLVLRSTYAATPELWRPMNQMRMGIPFLVTAVHAVCFVAIYAVLVRPRSIAKGLAFGFLYGIAGGLSMGFGTYSVMPIPARLAVGWFVGVLIEATIAGAVLGAMVRPPQSGELPS